MDFLNPQQTINLRSKEEQQLENIKIATKELATEINIIRQFAKNCRDELKELRGVMMDARDQQAILKDLKDKVEEIHNMICLVEEETIKEVKIWKNQK